MEVKEKNRSTTYLIPLLNQYADINKALLLNSYLYDINNPEINIPNITGLLMLFRWSNSDLSKQYEQRLLENNYIYNKYEVSSDSYMVFMKIPMEIAKDVKLITDGKYSKIDDKHKSLILKYWQFGATTRLYNVLYKTPQYKKELESVLDVKLDDEMELGSLFNLHAETYNRVTKTVELS